MAWQRRTLVASILLVTASLVGHGRTQRYAPLGDFRLASGDVIKSAVVGYRTAGRLNEEGSNAVLVVPWYAGTSRQLLPQIGPEKLVDSSKYFVIMVDAFGNGVSSSPSNSIQQPGSTFPSFTIADIVESHYQLVTRTFQLQRLHAVVGISMGGMQVFQWAATHPQFVRKAVSIVGTPQAQPDDQERWKAVIQRMRSSAWSRAKDALAKGKPRTALSELLISPDDYVRQAEATMKHDIAGHFGGSMDQAAAAIQAELMVVGTWTDEEVNPEPAFALGRLAGAEMLELDGRCRHLAPACESAIMWPAVARFLAR